MFKIYTLYFFGFITLSVALLQGCDNGEVNTKPVDAVKLEVNAEVTDTQKIAKSNLGGKSTMTLVEVEVRRLIKAECKFDKDTANTGSTKAELAVPLTELTKTYENIAQQTENFSQDMKDEFLLLSAYVGKQEERCVSPRFDLDDLKLRKALPNAR